MTAPKKRGDDSHVRALLARRDRAERRFNAEADRIDRLTESLRASRQQVQALKKEIDRRESHLGELGLDLGDLDAAIQAAREGEMGEVEALVGSRTPQSRRGPVGIRGAILKAMAGRPESKWSPRQVHVVLGQRMATLHNVGNTMRTMAADGEIKRLGHGAYRLAAEDQALDLDQDRSRTNKKTTGKQQRRTQTKKRR